MEGSSARLPGTSGIVTQPALPREQLQALFDISQVLNTIWEIDSLLERIMDIAIQTVNATLFPYRPSDL